MLEDEKSTKVFMRAGGLSLADAKQAVDLSLTSDQYKANKILREKLWQAAQEAAEPGRPA